MTDAEATHRAVPLWAKVLLAAGFAVAGWLFAGLLGGLTASADEAPQGDQYTPAKHHEHAPAQGGLLGGLLDTTLTTLVSTVDQVTTTVNTTVNTVTSSVDTLTTTVTATTDAVVQPVASTLIAPLTSAPKQQETTASTVTKTETRIATVPQETVPAAAPAPRSAPALPATVVAEQPVKHDQLPSPAVAPKTQAPASDHLVQAKNNQPVPAPSAPGGQSCSAVAAHDGGGNSKHSPAILGARTGVAQLASIGVPRRHAQVDNSRDAALPTTSPD
ncbi:hypothetical protein LWP59_01820 [Amycolatopsis acidiphila]|uniref:Uncharacterized protein n=1 Tax=Amycolatopsis acidiphila TaxID=715473 RepID=A0A558AN56_9PSEU|nr:hypothetical protein [Amycolatopsis acidiphila]TVT25697.1 hypothetical protein FNH06_02555 [Amycolatopsis acidiphila]UIJ60456.1 hypothetical protein LWP59_01820 [Amycolatopsis acidiphila]